MSDVRIDNPRAEIDAIDGEILRLLNNRAEIALRVGAAKTNVDTSLCDPAREREVLERMRAENPGPFDEQSIDNIFRRIIDESLLLQQSTFGGRLSDNVPNPSRAAIVGGRSRVAFLGESGTFSEEAAIGLLGDESVTVSMPTFEELFAAVDNGKADYVLTPLENSLIGSVHRCVDLLLQSSLNIVAEVILPISHYLVACKGATIDSILTVESHPAALAQCTRFFAEHPAITRVPADDTAGSVRRAIESGDITRAGIGGRRTAEIYGGRIIAEHLEDNRDNYTRFALLSPTADTSGTGTKISLVMRLRNQPGSLHGALRPFVRRGIDLLKIESLPIRETPDEYNFYLDVLVPANPGEMSGALDEVRGLAVDVRVLGQYSSTRLEPAR